MFTPFDYQEDCLAVLSVARQEGKRKALVVMATALGKTVTVAFDVKNWLKEQNGKKRVLYLCHQNDILYQAKTTFEIVLGHTRSYGYFHGLSKTMHNVDVLFASFQTMESMKESFAPDEFAYMIVDESHHSHAETYRQTIEYFKPEFLLAITATPDRLDELDIREIFGPEVYSLPLEEAMAHGYLVPVDYRLLADEILLSQKIETEKGKRSIAELNKTIFIPRRDEEIAKIIGQQVSAIRGPRIIVFCSSIRHCNHMAEVISDSFAIHSKIPEKERAVRVEMFRQGLINTVLVVDSFNEGIDIPSANVLVFLRSTDSRTIFFQQLGRGLRKFEGKNFVLVLDFVANCERILMVDSLFKKVSEIWDRVRDSSIHLDEREGQKSPMTLNMESIAFQEKIIPILKLLKHSLYPTWQEAAQAAKVLNITRSPQYRKEYKGDERLPSNPTQTYKDFPGWAVFTGRAEKDFYETLEQASIATKKFGIKSKSEYRERYKEDPRLHVAPEEFYEEFKTWASFLGTYRVRIKFSENYLIWQDAAVAAHKLGIDGKALYRDRYKQDPKLPSSPRSNYKNFPGWKEFSAYGVMEVWKKQNPT